MSDETDDDEVEKPKGPSLISQILVFLVLTAVAVGGGWGFGQFMRGQTKPVVASATAEASSDDGHETKPADDGHGKKDDAEKEGGHDMDDGAVAPGHPVSLEPIVTNLAAPPGVWVRLEMALTFDGSPEQPTIEAIHQDILAYMRSIQLRQVEGASGYLHLKADLKEIADIRSEGMARDVLVRTLLFE